MKVLRFSPGSISLRMRERRCNTYIPNLFQDYAAPDVMKNAGFPVTANVAPYSSFVSQHRQFLLLGQPTEWVFQKLLHSGASVALSRYI